MLRSRDSQGSLSLPFERVKTVPDLFPGRSSKRSSPAGTLMPFQRARGSATRPDPGDPWEFASAGLTEVDVSQVPGVEEEVSAEEFTEPSLAWPEGEWGVDVRRTQPVGLRSQGITCTSSFKYETFTAYSHLQVQNVHTLLSPSSSFKYKTITPYSHLRAAQVQNDHILLSPLSSFKYKTFTPYSHLQV